MALSLTRQVSLTTPLVVLPRGNGARLPLMHHLSDAKAARVWLAAGDGRVSQARRNNEAPDAVHAAGALRMTPSSAVGPMRPIRVSIPTHRALRWALWTHVISALLQALASAVAKLVDEANWSGHVGVGLPGRIQVR